MRIDRTPDPDNPQSAIRNPQSAIGCGVVYPPPRSLEQLMARQWEVRCPQCGAETRPLLTDEGYVDPHTQYAMSKYTQEMVGIRLGRRHRIPVSALRYSITQGPRQSFFNAYSGILRIFTLRMMNDRPPVAYEDGLMQRDYVHVRDVVAANLLCLDDPRTDYEAYNVGSGQPTTILEYAEALAQVLGKDLAPEVPGEFRLGDVRHIISDVSKLQALGWQVTADLETIIRDYVAWVETFTDLDDYFAEAEKVLKESGAVHRTDG
jgi:dTDP-L-rhamnose 4-epimerase